MTKIDVLHKYRETHKRNAAPDVSEMAGESPLQALRKAATEIGTPEIDDIRQLAKQVSLPESTVRGALSFYSDLHDADSELLICAGTSCRLAGSDMLRAQLEDSRTCRTAYCLGYCDKSPTILTEDASVFYGTSAVKLAAGELSDPPDEEPDIRCLDTEPIVTRRIGIGDFSSLEKASKAGAYSALQSALKHAPERVLKAVEKSGERGRGGAAFPTAVKWRSCADANGTGEAESSTATNSNRVQKYVIANGDEGDPGSFIDRLLLERDPHGVLEGLLLCAYAVGASEGVIFIRSEYPRAQEVMRQAVEEAREAGVLGHHILGSDFSCDVTVFTAMGSYVCGEETALINAIEGYRGEVRIRPPYPTQEGLFGKPTVVNNVETLVNIPIIVKDGAFNYRAIGTDYSSGTIAMCLNRGFRRPGVVEVEFGTTLRQVIDEAGGSATDRPLEAVLMGGPMGSLVFERDWDTPICYGAMKEKGLQLGHGGLIALGEKTDYLKLLEQLLEFMSEESCGKCVPCRIGSRRALNLVREKPLSESRESLRRVFNVMEAGSLCAFGQSMPNTLRQVMVAIGGQS